jgi:hypothetical protein
MSAKKKAIYHRTLDPNCPADVAAMVRMMRTAKHNRDGSASIQSGPMSDRDEQGHRMRLPAGVDIYTPYGWNLLPDCAAAFQRGETVWIEAAVETN